jgi:retinol dehydrogenase 14
VTANCVDPGIVRTNFGRENQPLLWRLFMPVVTPFMRTPDQGRRRSCTWPPPQKVEGLTGRYFHDKQPRRSSRGSYDRALAQRLWRTSEQLTTRPERLRTPQERTGPGDRRAGHGPA